MKTTEREELEMNAIHYHLPEDRKPSPLVQAFMEAADAAALLPPFMPDQPDDDDNDDDDEDWF
jgi:hypothetical protein